MKLMKYSIRRLLFCFSLLLFNCLKLQAATTDSLVYFNDLAFKNDTDKIAFVNFITKKNEMALLQLYLKSFEQKSLDTSNNIELTINKFVQKISKKNSNKNEVEKVQNLRDAVKENFLKTYRLNSRFSELFETGTYDCITSTALYAIVLFKLDIPYQIMEDKNGIYIVAYPLGKKIIIENALSEKKYAVFNEYFTGKYSKSMFYARIIPPEEFEKGNTEMLFEKYYFKTEAITLLQLASFQFNNFSMMAADERKKQEAFDYALKSCFLDSSLRYQVVLKYHLFNALGSNNYNDKYDVEKLVFLCRYNNQKDNEINNAFVISEYKRLLNTVLIKNADLNTLKKYHTLLIHNIHEISLKQEIEFIYHLEIARIGLNKKNDKKTEIYHIKSAYNIKPEDKEVKSIIAEILNISINNTKDSEIVLKIIDEFCLEFPFLAKSASILRIKAHGYLDLAYKNYTNGLIKEGDEFLAKNEDLCKKNNVSLDTEIIEMGYLSAAKYYFNSGNRIQAKEYLNKGLKLAPQSIKIKDKLKMVN
jgi:hypothetical protein